MSTNPKVQDDTANSRALPDEAEKRMQEMKARMELRKQVREENIASPVVNSPAPDTTAPVVDNVLQEWNHTLDKEDYNIWLIADAPIKCPQEIHGVFYTKECYVMLIKRATFYAMKIWFGSEVTHIEKEYAFAKAGELASRFENIVVSMETCKHESAEFRAIFKTIVLLKGSANRSSCSLVDKLFMFSKNIAEETNTEPNKETSCVYWGSDIVCYVNNASLQTQVAITHMTRIYNKRYQELFSYQDFDAFLTKKQSLSKPKIMCHLYAVTDELKIITIFKGPSIDSNLLASGKIYIFSKYIDDELTESIVYETLNTSKKMATLFRTKCWSMLKAPSIHYIVEKVSIVEMQHETALTTYISIG